MKHKFCTNKTFSDLNRFWREKRQKDDHVIKHVTSILKALSLNEVSIMKGISKQIAVYDVI